jgi:hypothetical protein
MAQADTGQHLMRPARQPPQHRARVVIAGGLAENRAVDHNSCVRTKDGRVGLRRLPSPNSIAV